MVKQITVFLVLKALEGKTIFSCGTKFDLIKYKIQNGSKREYPYS